MHLPRLNRARLSPGHEFMTDGAQTLNHGNTHVFTPIANELFQRAPQFVHVKVHNFVLCVSVSMLSPGIRRAQVDGVQGVSFGLDTALDYIPLSSSYAEIYNIHAYFSGPSVSMMDVANVTVRRMADWEAVKAERDTQLRQIARAGKQ
ncbi:hypothetical protein V8E55_002707 [Tylopilus felleus]